MAKNKIFIGINRAEHPEYEDGVIIFLIAKDKPKAFELGNTSAGLPFSKIIQIGETEEDEQVLFTYKKCRCAAESVQFGTLLNPFAQTLFGSISSEEDLELWKNDKRL